MRNQILKKIPRNSICLFLNIIKLIHKFQNAIQAYATRSYQFAQQYWYSTNGYYPYIVPVKRIAWSSTDC